MEYVVIQKQIFVIQGYEVKLDNLLKFEKLRCKFRKHRRECWIWQKLTVMAFY